MSKTQRIRHWLLKDHDREEDLSLIKNFSEMEYLTLIGHQFDEITYSDLCDSIVCMPNLKVFSVSQSTGPLNENMIDALTENCANLEYLHLYKFQMENVFLNCLKKFGKLHKLKILNFSSDIINDEVLDEITKGTNQLERLVLGSNTLITVNGICAVLKNCKELVELDISWCKGITKNNIGQIDSFYTALCKDEPERLRNETLKVSYHMGERAQLLGGEQWRWEQRKDRLKQLITGWDVHLETIRKRFQDRFCEEAASEEKDIR
uniref:F-box/LRR-repeat protein 15-like leucin rich repeat domain-containing protein n=1 Tax=Ditylenchus dipsaci TaxID=166011 RepID=A0A915DGN4_9BILA